MFNHQNYNICLIFKHAVLLQTKESPGSSEPWAVLTSVGPELAVEIPHSYAGANAQTTTSVLTSCQVGQPHRVALNLPTPNGLRPRHGT